MLPARLLPPASGFVPAGAPSGAVHHHADRQLLLPGHEFIVPAVGHPPATAHQRPRAFAPAVLDVCAGLSGTVFSRCAAPPLLASRPVGCPEALDCSSRLLKAAGGINRRSRRRSLAAGSACCRQRSADRSMAAAMELLLTSASASARALPFSSAAALASAAALSSASCCRRARLPGASSCRLLVRAAFLAGAAHGCAAGVPPEPSVSRRPPTGYRRGRCSAC